MPRNYRCGLNITQKSCKFNIYFLYWIKISRKSIIFVAKLDKRTKKQLKNDRENRKNAC